MLPSMSEQLRANYNKDPAVYEPAVYERSKHFLNKSGSVPRKSESHHHKIAEITPHLYLCGARAVSQRALLNLNVTHVINCTPDVPHVNLPGLKTTRISLDDRPSSNIRRYFSKMSDKIRKESICGGKTLVHCYAGVSRSVSICLAYLMKYYKLTLKNSFLFIKSQKSNINPNVGFWQQLIEYEKKLHGFTSVPMMRTPRGIRPDVGFVTPTPAAKSDKSASASGANTRPSARPYMVTFV